MTQAPGGPVRRTLTSGTSLDSLKKEARQWLKALRARDAQAHARLTLAHPGAPADPGLREVQHAIALEHGVAGWIELRTRLVEARLAEARLAAADTTADDASLGADNGSLGVDDGSHGAEDDSRDAAVRALLAAADQGDVARVTALLDRHPDIVSARGSLDGHTGLRTALHFAVDHEAVVRVLLERGADPNVRDEGDEAMPLHFAAEKQDLAVIRLLIEHGADPIGTGDYHELDVIGWAACWDYVEAKPEVVEYLLAHGAVHNIFSAVAMGDVDSIRALAARSRADLDRRMDLTNHRRRPLHLAVVKKQAAALSALVDLGADLEALDEAALTALDQAALTGATELAQFLIDRGAEIRLPAAVALRRTHDIERLLRLEPDSLKPGRRWGTLIIRASAQAPGDVIETLIRFGAAVDVWDDPKTSVDATSGLTPLHAAAWSGNADAAAVLLKHHANLSVRDHKYGSTPAGWADYAGRTAVRDLILQGPIDLFEALDFNLTSRIPEILDRDPQALNRPFREYATLPPGDADRRHQAWVTPLVWAVAHDMADAARLLLDRGATLTVASDGRTLHDIAREPGRETVAELLRTHPRTTTA